MSKQTQTPSGGTTTTTHSSKEVANKLGQEEVESLKEPKSNSGSDMTKAQAQKIVDHWSSIVFTKAPNELKRARKVLGED